jgi:pimeloyl-ACP methyl ester carboxylesterase
MPSLRLIALLLASAHAVPAWAGASTLVLEDCRISAGPGFPGIKARCGDFERPLDPANPGGETIVLRVAVVPALSLDPEPDPIVPLAGGPGQGVTQFYTAYSRAFEPLRRNRDILLVDQRGTGRSAPLTCELGEEILEGSVADDEAIRVTRECLDELPHDPRYFTTSVAVRDLDAVREALGYPALNVYGVSYGSRVAQHYARRFPASTRTIVLDGVVPPELALGPDIALESQRAVDDIFARCAEQPACNERFPDLAAEFASVLAMLREAPIEVDVPDPVSGENTRFEFGADEFAVAIRLLAYQPNTIALIPLFVFEAATGNFDPLAAQFLTTTQGLAEAIAVGMHNSVMCSEDTSRYDHGALDREALEASYLGTNLVDLMADVCSIWPTGPVDDDLDENLDTDIPTLLLSGTADPITPPGYAAKAAADLGRAWLLTGKHQGHGQIAVGCMPEVVAGFVAAGELEDGADDCFKDSYVMPFFLTLSGPNP